jgi:hypothetical protein
LAEAVLQSTPSRLVILAEFVASPIAQLLEFGERRERRTFALPGI